MRAAWALIKSQSTRLVPINSANNRARLGSEGSINSFCPDNIKKQKAPKTNVLTRLTVLIHLMWKDWDNQRTPLLIRAVHKTAAAKSDRRTWLTWIEQTVNIPERPTNNRSRRSQKIIVRFHIEERRPKVKSKYTTVLTWLCASHHSGLGIRNKSQHTSIIVLLF